VGALQRRPHLSAAPQGLIPTACSRSWQGRWGGCWGLVTPHGTAQVGDTMQTLPSLMSGTQSRKPPCPREEVTTS
jgi:hypothetical protein